MSPIINPTIGRVMWYKDSQLSDQFMPAVVCYVWSELMVNLVVFDRNGIAHPKTSVIVYQDDPDTCPECVACWMPYQKGQAAKHEAESKEPV